jgi:hypothetical protein
MSACPPFASDNSAQSDSSVWRVEPGTYIAFELDLDCIAAQLPEGSAVAEFVKGYPVGRFVGLVISSYTFKDSQTHEAIEELTVNFAANFLPPGNAWKDDWLPIEPCTKLDWPMRNAPLQTETMFPWMDFTQWTTLGTRLRITELNESSLRFALSVEEFGRFEECAEIDNSGKGELPQETDLATWLQIPVSCAFPAKIWRDIREADQRNDPNVFARELEQLDRSVTFHSLKLRLLD